MGLRFIYGTAGTGKSSFCFEEIKNIKNKNEKIYIITPEQFSYSAEKKLLDILEENSSINAEVISFNRMANRVFTEVGGLNDILISKSSKAMLIYSILEKEKRNLKYLNSSNDNIELIIKEITEFKKHNISTQKLETGINEIKNIVLKEKLNDINKIYNIYENYMKNKYIDEEDLLTKLYNKLPESKMFDNSIVYIDEFSGFIKQEYNIVTEILKKAKQVSITICTDDLSENTEEETDIFYFNKQFKKLLTDCAQNVDKKLEKSIFLNSKNRFKNKELLYLEENIYNKNSKKYLEENKNIKLFLAKNPYTELEHVAEEINKLIREEKYKYNDIAIITKNIDSINNIAKAIFSKYNIPIFIDEKTEITENAIIKYILSILEIYSSNWNTDYVFNYIKSGFLDIEEKEVYNLEKYTKKYGINRAKWYKGKWIENEDIREKIINPLLELKKELEQEKTAKNITEKIYKYLIKNNIQEKINKKINEYKKIGETAIAEEYKASLNVLIDVLDEIVEIFGNEKITIDKYKEILKTGLKNREVGKIPQNIDQVILGDIDRTRSHKVRAVFIIGINDGVFPSVNKTEGFLNDNDREVLKECNLEIAKGTLDNLFEEQFNVYKALTTAEEKVYLSYTSSNKDGDAQRPSIIINKIKKIFPKLKEESDVISTKSLITNEQATFGELLKNIRKIKNGEKIEDIWVDVYNWYLQNSNWKDRLNKSMEGLNYTNKAEKLTSQNIEKLYGNKLRTSISRLEKYKNCPFSFHLTYGLKIKPEEEYKLNSLDTGSFMHDIVDTFFERISNFEEITNEEIEKIVEEIINEKLKLEKNYIFSTSQKFITLTSRLKKTIKESIKYIVYQIKNSEFKPEGHEVEFTKADGDMEIYGKIDRLDIAENEEGQYIRIIDYKSSKKNVNLNEMLAGTQIQLITYIDAISEQMKKEPAGIFYFNLIEPIVNGNPNFTEEEIDENIRKQFKLNGLLLADLKVVKMMDKNLKQGSSNIIPAFIDKTGNLSNSKSNTITKEQFEFLQKKIRKLLKEIQKEIFSGNIDIKPMYNKAKKQAFCKNCEFKTICAFDPKQNKYEYIQNKKQKLILEEIQEEIGGRKWNE